MFSPVKSRRLVALACLAPAAFAGDPDPPAAVHVTSVEVRELPNVSADGLLDMTALKLDLPALTVKVPARSGKKGKAAAASASSTYSGESIALKQGPVALNLKVPAPEDLTSGASLNLNLPAGALKAEATASVGKEEGQTAFWHRDAAQVEARISGPLGTAFNVSGENKLSLSYRAPESIGASDQAAHVVRTESQSGRASLSLPLNPVQVTVGGDSTSEHTQQGAPGNAASFAQSAVRTADHTAYVNAEWQPVAGLRLEGGTTAKVANISWQDAHSSSHRSVNPHLSATITPFRDTTVTAKVEHATAVYDAAAFANYVRADKAANVSGFEPDHAWQIETRIEQRVGPASLSASYTASRNGTVTEFAEVGGMQAPASTRLDSRDAVALAVSLPLGGLGLHDTELSSQAEWQNSRVLDPVTQKLRSASGEVPRQLTLSMAHELPKANLSIGLKGAFIGSRTSYQVSEVSNTSAEGSLGAFLKYRPGSYEVDLDVNGLYGASTENTFYNGLRDASQVGRTVVRDNSGPLINLSLHKAL